MEIVLNDGTNIIKRGSLAQVVADNLGANSIGGFVESFVANYLCNTCLTSRTDFQRCNVADNCQMRNRENYEEHLQLLTEDPQSVPLHGIKCACPLNQSRYFNITTKHSPDIMHDILEGLGKMECKLVLSQLIFQDKLFSIDILNARITNFDYGFEDVKNKPSTINCGTLHITDSNLKNSASQMWCLLRFLPLLIGDKVPRNHAHWQLLLKLRQIMDIVFAREITEGMCHYLKYLIKDYHFLFQNLFLDINLIPKHHFIIHYPNALMEVGPIINCWSMRFEAKHYFGKLIAGVVCNFKDICYTIAERHQIQQCHEWHSTKMQEYFAKKFSAVKVFETECKDLILEKFPGLFEQGEIYFTAKASIYGTEYRAGMIVVTDMFNNLPLFGEIQSIFIFGDTPYIFGEMLDTHHFDEHYHSYVCAKPQRAILFFVKQINLKDFHPLYVCSSYEESQDRTKYTLKNAIN
ncbi:uncharacterized protein LOC117115483 [Anneissia japonica]|uniref:uncharacterized protein LOC117115483 n=1 Tax=Anneissia japonica TaxID=1529436 RepID=UPI001425A966|nr:uncharacterized protein LOC117115483 [Anneissia japonica]